MTLCEEKSLYFYNYIKIKIWYSLLFFGNFDIFQEHWLLDAVIEKLSEVYETVRGCLQSKLIGILIACILHYFEQRFSALHYKGLIVSVLRHFKHPKSYHECVWF